MMILCHLKINKPKYILALCTALLLPASALANFPRGCESSGFGFDDPYVIFNDTEQQTYFLIQNHSALPIQLERVETEDAFMSPKLESKLNPARWSAFASDMSNVHFQCFTHTNGTPILINCRQALTICQYPRAKFALSNKGTYWVSTNKAQKKIIHDSTRKGILLRW
ncbi:MAG: enhanced entry protein EnhB [Legionellaceae bacterium]|nr:enhanced entry protein EnhB [Legionellaceae bacterium]